MKFPGIIDQHIIFVLFSKWSITQIFDKISLRTMYASNFIESEIS